MPIGYRHRGGEQIKIGVNINILRMISPAPSRLRSSPTPQISASLFYPLSTTFARKRIDMPLMQKQSPSAKERAVKGGLWIIKPAPPDDH